MIPYVQYVKTSDGAHIAYQVFGQGAFDLVFVPGFAYNVEHAWRLEPVARAYRRLAGFSRVIVFDRRGTGLSDRIDEASPPTLDARMDDIRAVMDAAGVERAVLFGYEDGSEPVRRLRREQSVKGPRGRAPRVSLLAGCGRRTTLGPGEPTSGTTTSSASTPSGGRRQFADFIVDWAWPSHARRCSLPAGVGVVSSSVGEPGRGCCIRASRSRHRYPRRPRDDPECRCS